MSLSLPLIGPKTEDKLQKLGINTPKDLLYHFPHRYLDFSKAIPISQINLNENKLTTIEIRVTTKFLIIRAAFRDLP